MIENQATTIPIPEVTRASDMPDVIAPDGSEIRLLAGEAQGIRRASACEVTLPAGQVSKPVWHRQVEEVWYILEGDGMVWRCPPGMAPAEAHPVTVGPGDALTIPTGWRFQFRADLAGKLRFLCVTTPPWPGADEAQPAPERGLWPPTI
jgi:mannose-6-phosphate isomerase-like protein (cupin superfamily)